MSSNHIDDLTLRISEAMDHLDQSNTIFNFVLFTLSGFEGFGDPKLDHQLEAMVNVSRLLERMPDTTREIIGTASREIALKRLPRLLCIALVSAVETCVEDVTRQQLRALDPQKSEEELERETRRLMRGGPMDYLPLLAERFTIPFFNDSQWDNFFELAATRNILVHRAEPIADERYVRNAGPAVRASVGEELDVDNSYLTTRYAVAKVLMLNLIQVVQGKPKLVD